jgi:hypothetical protein
MQDYNHRLIPISELYTDPQDCEYYDSVTKKEHPLFQKTEFGIQELIVYG